MFDRYEGLAQPKKSDVFPQQTESIERKRPKDTKPLTSTDWLKSILGSHPHV
jgi:hypothetical protein